MYQIGCKAFYIYVWQLTVSPDQRPGLEEPSWFKPESFLRSPLVGGKHLRVLHLLQETPSGAPVAMRKYSHLTPCVTES